jgi:hypothetical protein
MPHNRFTCLLLTYILSYLLTYLCIYLLTPWSRIHLKKLTSSQLVKKLPAFNGTRRFITAFTKTHHVPMLSQIIPVHAPPSHFLTIYLNIIPRFMPGSYLWSLFLRFPHPTLFTPVLTPYVLHVQPIPFFSI